MRGRYLNDDIKGIFHNHEVIVRNQSSVIGELEYLKKQIKEMKAMIEKQQSNGTQATPHPTTTTRRWY